LRHIAPVREEYAVSKDGMKMFGIMGLETTTFQGCRFALGIRNAHQERSELCGSAQPDDVVSLSPSATPSRVAFSASVNQRH
jgi:hypothetical protein